MPRYRYTQGTVPLLVKEYTYCTFWYFWQPISGWTFFKMT